MDELKIMLEANILAGCWQCGRMARCLHCMGKGYIEWFDSSVIELAASKRVQCSYCDGSGECGICKRKPPTLKE